MDKNIGILFLMAGSLYFVGCVIEPVPNPVYDTAYTYNGSLYQGMVSFADSNSPISYNYSDSNDVLSHIQIIKPEFRNIEADGFFTLKGIITYESSNQYILVTVSNVSTEEHTAYWLRSNFQQRIWLPFGSGDYIVTVRKTVVKSTNLNYDGDITEWSFYPACYTFNVKNINTNDGRYIFPSAYVQSDNPLIAEKSAELAFGITDERRRIEVMHDFVVTNLYYDSTSLLAGKRKKQDAVSTMVNKTGVCEGYTALFMALCRAAGIKTMYISSDAISHAWANVFYSDDWFLVDTTWDDPQPNDTNTSQLFRTYFLVDLTGIDDDHPQTGIILYKSLNDTPKSAPTLRQIFPLAGFPSGLY